jgi:ketosteroid isomerase-like protein
MGDHKHAATYREALDQFNDGDPAALTDLISDDVEWWAIGAADPIRGKAALMSYMEENMGDWNITTDLHDVISNDSHMIALVNASATHADGQSLQYRTAEIHHVDAEGKITQRWAFSDDTAAIVDFFG